MVSRARSFANLNTHGSWIPDEDSSYDLGSPTKKWKSLYVSSDTIFLGDSGSISAGAGGSIILPAIQIGAGENSIKLEVNETGKLKTKSTVGGVEQEVETINTSSFINLEQDGDLTVLTGLKRWYAPKETAINKIVARVATAPEGSAINITVNKSGSSGATLVIADGATKVVNNSPNITLAEDDYLTVDVTQIGSSTAGSDLIITFTYS